MINLKLSKLLVWHLKDRITEKHKWKNESGKFIDVHPSQSLLIKNIQCIMKFTRKLVTNKNNNGNSAYPSSKLQQALHQISLLLLLWPQVVMNGHTCKLIYKKKHLAVKNHIKTCLRDMKNPTIQCETTILLLHIINYKTQL